MKLHEYQAKEVLAKFGVATLPGVVCTTADECEKAARDLGGGPVVVKAQVHAGGRGKAGGVKLASTPEEAREKAKAILGLQIKGLTVEKVLIAPAEAPGDLFRLFGRGRHLAHGDRDPLGGEQLLRLVLVDVHGIVGSSDCSGYRAQVPSAKYLVPSAKCLVPSARYVPFLGTWHL